MTRRITSVAIGLLVCWRAIPALAGIAPDGEATQVRNAQPGDSYRGSIVVRNTGAAVAQVKLYQTDYTFFADGKNSFDMPGTLARSNAGWVRLNREQITVAPDSVATVDYEVQVPGEAALAGTYWSVVMVQELPPAEAVGRAAGVRSEARTDAAPRDPDHHGNRRFRAQRHCISQCATSERWRATRIRRRPREHRRTLAAHRRVAGAA